MAINELSVPKINVSVHACAVQTRSETPSYLLDTLTSDKNIGEAMTGLSGCYTPA